MTGNVTPNLAGGQAAPDPQQSAPLAPMPQPVPTTQPTFFGHLLSGILSGLSGGVRGATEDMAVAGHGPTQGNGAAYGMQAYQKLQQDQAAQQQNAQEQAQQSFQNQLRQREDVRQQQLSDHQAMIGHLQQMELSARLQNAPQEAQDAADAAEAHKAELLQGNTPSGAPLAVLPDEQSAAKWLADNGKKPWEVAEAHPKISDGSRPVQLFPVSKAKLDAPAINGLIHDPDYHVSPGTTMNFDQASAYANDLNLKNQQKTDAAREKQAEETRREQFEMSKQKQREGFEASQNTPAPSASSALDPDVENAANAVLAHRTAPDQIGSGMGKEAAAFRQKVALRVLAKDPTANLKELSDFAGQSRNTGTQNLIGSGRTLFGTKDKPGTLDTVEDAINAVPKSSMPWLSQASQHTAYQLGSPEMARLHAIAPDVNAELAKFNTGQGGQTTDLRLKQAGEQLNAAQTPEQFRSAMQGIRQVAGERMDGVLGQNPYLHKMAEDIQDPRAPRSPSTGQPEGTRIQLKDGTKQIKRGGKWVNE